MKSLLIFIFAFQILMWSKASHKMKGMTKFFTKETFIPSWSLSFRRQQQHLVISIQFYLSCLNKILIFSWICTCFLPSIFNLITGGIASQSSWAFDTFLFVSRLIISNNFSIVCKLNWIWIADDDPKKHFCHFVTLLSL